MMKSVKKSKIMQVRGTEAGIEPINIKYNGQQLLYV